MPHKHQKTKTHKAVLLTVLILIVLVIGGLFLFKQLTAVKPPVESKTPQTTSKKNEQTIYPTLYVTGSSGITTDNIDVLIKAVTATPNCPAKPGLKIIVDTQDNYKVSVIGKISKDNKYPTIAVGMTKGTNDTLLYQYTLKVVMDYLVSHYNVPWCNMLGYSSGGSGVLRYLINYSKDKSLPTVKKFISLDGEFNQEIPLQPRETLEDLLEMGPVKKSDEYLYFEKNYSKLSADVSVSLMEGNYKNSGTTDDIIPWSDAFSVYHLLKINGNSVTRYIFTGANAVTNHGHVCQNPMAQAYIEKYFYK